MPVDHATLAALSTRRSPALKSLVEPAPSGAELDTLLTIAARVPDHAKLTPWRFVLVSGPARAKLADAIVAAVKASEPAVDPVKLAQARVPVELAPLTVIVVSSPKPHPKVPEWEQVLSAGAVGMNMLHAARALGYGGVWFSEWYTYDRGLMNHLGLAAHEKIVGTIHIGTPSEAREDRPRPELAQIVTRYG